jgi:DNA-binding LacI/PurR family transcriptional regulator
MQRRIRIKDVAKLAGVSPAVVSTVMNDRRDAGIRISAETRARVLETIHKLGYVPNPVARNLARGKTQLLGVFTYEALFPIEQTNFFYPFLVGIEQEAEAQDFDLLLFTSGTGNTGKRQVFQRGANRLQLADGAILFGQNAVHEEVIQLQEERYPFVYIGRIEVEKPVCYIAADYVSASQEIVNHLFSQGHRHIAYLGHEMRSLSFKDRESGYRRAYTEHGFTPDPKLMLFQNLDMLRSDHLRTLLESGMTAIVCENHRLAVALLQHAQALKLSIPEAFSFALLSDHNSEPILQGCTTFHIPRYEMGVQAVRQLITMLSHPDTPLDCLTLPCSFVPGHSVRAI